MICLLNCHLKPEIHAHLNAIDHLLVQVHILVVCLLVSEFAVPVGIRALEPLDAESAEVVLAHPRFKKSSQTILMVSHPLPALVLIVVVELLRHAVSIRGPKDVLAINQHVQ